MKNDSQRVQYIFDEMANDYDEMKDLWYSWLFSRIHFLIAKNFLTNWKGQDKTVLDIGCGTGLQSFLYARCGAKVTGIDVSEKLIQEAKNKKIQKIISLFPANFNFVKKYDKIIQDIVDRNFPSVDFTYPNFLTQNALDESFKEGEFDHVNCCGSVLSFIDNHRKVLELTQRYLKSGGSFIFEVESKYNFDLIWGIVDSLTGGRLGFEMSFQEAIAPLFSWPASHSSIEYPFGENENPVYMPIKLFSKSGLIKEFEQAGLRVEKVKTIHSLTNIVPSTILDSEKPSKFTRFAFSILSFLEENIPINFPGCSLVLIGKKAS